MTRQRAFTLVELLVVIAIIVILLALLVGGLERALKAAERSRCGANQRGAAQSCAAYALEMERTFPPWNNMGPAPAVSTDSAVIKSNIYLRIAPGAANATEAANRGAATGLGHLIVQGRWSGVAAGGDAAYCPSLDTSSGFPVNTGMNQNALTASSGKAANDAVGIAGWNLNQPVVGGYMYRAKSYAAQHSGGTIRTNIAKATFAITADLVCQTKGAGTAQGTDGRFGRPYHHITGWMATFGDGHAQYVEDPEGPYKDGATIKGKMERDITGNFLVVAPDTTPTTPNLKTEDVFEWLGGIYLKNTKGEATP